MDNTPQVGTSDTASGVSSPQAGGGTAMEADARDVKDSPASLRAKKKISNEGGPLTSESPEIKATLPKKP